MLSEFPEMIETEGVFLRPMMQADLATVVAHLNDPAIARWMAAIRLPCTDADAEEILSLSRDPAQCLRVLEKDGAMIGCLRLAPNIWFWLAPGSQGHNLMSHVLRAAIAAYFRHPAPPLLATCREDNHPAQSILSRLGFSRGPASKKMFFHNEARALPCHEYVMCAEQWHLLYPPKMTHGPLLLRPAVQKDAPILARMLPRHEVGEDEIWPCDDAAIGAFIETHRCRIPGRGLFAMEDDNRRVIGMALLDDASAIRAVRFQTPEEASRYTSRT